MPIQSDFVWYSAESEKRGIPQRCPHATVHACPRYYQSASLLAKQRITASLDKETDDRIYQKWKNSDLWPVLLEDFTSMSGGGTPNCFSNFCPEISYSTFGVFARLVIRFFDELDQESVYKQLEREGAKHGEDWRWRYLHVEPMHYSQCPVYSLLSKETKMSEVNFHGPITGQVNVAGKSISSPILQMSLGELQSKIDDSNASPEEKEAAKSKLQEFLSHPVVAAIVGGLSGTIGS